MSPTASEFEGIIGRELKPKDLLIDKDGACYEVIDPFIDPEHAITKHGTPLRCEAMGVRRITERGRVFSKDVLPKKFSAWSDIVPRQNRTDIGIISRLVYKIADKTSIKPEKVSK